MEKKFKKYHIHYNNISVEIISAISKKSLKQYIKDRITSDIDEWYGLKMCRFSMFKIEL